MVKGGNPPPEVRSGDPGADPPEGARLNPPRRFRRQAHASSEQAEIVRRALAGAAGTTLRRAGDVDDERRAQEDGAA